MGEELILIDNKNREEVENLLPCGTYLYTLDGIIMTIEDYNTFGLDFTYQEL